MADETPAGVGQEEILDEAVIFYVVRRLDCEISAFHTSRQAGFETSSNALAFAVHFLAHHPDVATRVFDEVISVCGESLESISSEQVEDLEFVRRHYCSSV